MRNKKFTTFLKKAAKESFWDGTHSVTLGYAYRWGVSGHLNSSEAKATLRQLGEEMVRRSREGLPLTAAQQRLLELEEVA